MFINIGIVGVSNVIVEAMVDVDEVLEVLHRRCVGAMNNGKETNEGMTTRLLNAQNGIDTGVMTQECKRIAFDCARRRYAADGATETRYFLVD